MDSPFLGFINNAAILIAFSVVYSILIRRIDSMPWKVLAGVMLGATTIGVMLTPWQLQPGVFFDTRAIILCLGGMFLGWIPATIAAAMAASFRIYQGGAGAFTGTLWVVSASVWGLVWLRLRKREAFKLSGIEYYICGLSLSILLLLLMFTMPEGMPLKILSNITLPTVIVFPVVTVLLAKLFSNNKLQEINRLKLIESENKYKQLVENSNVIILMLDNEGCFTFVNKHGEDFFGYEPNEIIGKNVIGSIVPEGDPNLVNHIKDILKTPEKYPLHENENICKNGQRVFVEWQNTVIRNQVGERIGIQCIGQDITEKMRLQSQIIRTAQLASIGELAAGVAHEINNPISGVINYALILKLRIDNAEYKSILDKIVDEGQRITTTVKSLLSFSRDESSDYQRIDIKEMLDNTLSLVESQLKSDGIEIEISLPENECFIEGNSHQLEQVMLNLFSNARYTLKEKFPSFNRNKKIEIKIESKNDNYFYFSFTDYGKGIPEDLLSKIFDPFFTTKEPGIGTGIGLSICQDIIDLHKGELDIKTKVDDYTTFIIKLPCYSCD